MTNLQLSKLRKIILTKSSSKFLFKCSCTFVLVIELVNISRNSLLNNPSKCRSSDIKSNTNQRDRPLSLYFFMTFLRYEINSELEELNLNSIQIPLSIIIHLHIRSQNNKTT